MGLLGLAAARGLLQGRARPTIYFTGWFAVCATVVYIPLLYVSAITLNTGGACRFVSGEGVWRALERCVVGYSVMLVAALGMNVAVCRCRVLSLLMELRAIARSFHEWNAHKLLPSPSDKPVAIECSPEAVQEQASERVVLR